MEGVLIVFGLIFAFGFTAWHVISYELRKADEKEKAEQEELQKKLKEEKRKPMFRIVFELPSGSKEYMEYLEPIIESDKIIPSRHYTSVMLDTCFEAGFFRNEEGSRFPSCNVVKAWLEEEHEYLVNERNK